MLISYKANGAANKEIYRVPINEALKNMAMNSVLKAFSVGNTEHEEGMIEKGELKDFD